MINKNKMSKELDEITEWAKDKQNFYLSESKKTKDKKLKIQLDAGVTTLGFVLIKIKSMKSNNGLNNTI